MERTSSQTPLAVGIIVLILLAIFTYFLVRDSYGLRTTVFGEDTASMEVTNDDEEEVNPARIYTGFNLSEEQKQALISAGVDANVVPNSITGDQEICFVNMLGEERVVEIKNGAVPNAMEFTKAQSCIQ